MKFYFEVLITLDMFIGLIHCYIKCLHDTKFGFLLNIEIFKKSVEVYVVKVKKAYI